MLLFELSSVAVWWSFCSGVIVGSSVRAWSCTSGRISTLACPGLTAGIAGDPARGPSSIPEPFRESFREWALRKTFPTVLSFRSVHVAKTIFESFTQRNSGNRLCVKLLPIVVSFLLLGPLPFLLSYPIKRFGPLAMLSTLQVQRVLFL